MLNLTGPEQSGGLIYFFAVRLPNYISHYAEMKILVILKKSFFSQFLNMFCYTTASFP